MGSMSWFTFPREKPVIRTRSRRESAPKRNTASKMIFSLGFIERVSLAMKTVEDSLAGCTRQGTGAARAGTERKSCLKGRTL